MIRTKFDPQWASIVEQWKQTQRDLRRRMVVAPLEPLPRFVAGADVAFSTDKQTVFAAAVVYDRDDRRVIEIAHARREAEFPYVPGFLAFREGPALFDALAGLKHSYGAILFDGQGFAHPRRCGLAAYMSISLDVPGVGVAKSRLIGTHGDPPAEAGGFCALMDGEEQIGMVLRTQMGVKPLFVSLGHRVDLASARELVLACCTRYRVPEPTRQADIEVARLKRQSAAG